MPNNGHVAYCFYSSTAQKIIINLVRGAAARGRAGGTVDGGRGVGVVSGEERDWGEGVHI